MSKRKFRSMKIKMDNYHLRYELAGADEIITKLKQQLAEKDKEIEMLKEKYYERLSKTNDKLLEIIQKLNKERE